MASPNPMGFDPARLEVLHTTTKRFVDEGKHAGIITLLARDGKAVDVQTYGYRDVEQSILVVRTFFTWPVGHRPCAALPTTV